MPCLAPPPGGAHCHIAAGDPGRDGGEHAVSFALLAGDRPDRHVPHAERCGLPECPGRRGRFVASSSGRKRREERPEEEATKLPPPRGQGRGGRKAPEAAPAPRRHAGERCVPPCTGRLTGTVRRACLLPRDAAREGPEEVPGPGASDKADPRHFCLTGGGPLPRMTGWGRA